MFRMADEAYAVPDLAQHATAVIGLSSRADALRYILYACPGTDSRARSSPCSVLFALTAAPAPAQTPLDTLVMAKDIGDIITFDPGESFELTAGEILANVYDRIMTFEPEDPGTLTGGVAESHTVSDDGRTITLRIRDGLTGPARSSTRRWSGRATSSTPDAARNSTVTCSGACRTRART